MSLSFDLPALHRRDIKQIVTLLALLRACSVTEASRQLEISQPAVSKSLERLRREFGDPLLVRDGNRMRRTPKGEELMPRLEEALSHLGQVLAQPGAFDPARIARHVRIGANDHLQQTIAPALIQRVRLEAPGVQLQFRPVGMWRLDHLLSEGLVDLILGATVGLQNLRSAPLLAEDLVCIACARQPIEQLDFAAFCMQPQLDISPAGIGLIPGLLDQAAAELGGRRTVVGIVSAYQAVPATLAGTPMIAVVPRGALRSFQPGIVKLVETRFRLPRYEVSMWWHSNTHTDPLARWLREAIQDIAARC
ncbi:LysR family transcriptional regulator [Variovorax sp. PDNC026]|uniref:LysR family transcriptional regulator n=1 Tax=Variovorax sp. PDNC026 TaxID=2811425 RepID=UPI00196698A0|nr:LysR family transcriptional regulator [Variovorax sp. PDNC026]QRY31856.1 LysR family transcriptional regulator [Variovorax sp. PDNC026]